MLDNQLVYHQKCALQSEYVFPGSSTECNGVSLNYPDPLYQMVPYGSNTDPLTLLISN